MNKSMVSMIKTHVMFATFLIQIGSLLYKINKLTPALLFSGSKNNGRHVSPVTSQKSFSLNQSTVAKKRGIQQSSRCYDPSKPSTSAPSVESIVEPPNPKRSRGPNIGMHSANQVQLTFSILGI